MHRRVKLLLFALIEGNAGADLQWHGGIQMNGIVDTAVKDICENKFDYWLIIVIKWD